MAQRPYSGTSLIRKNPPPRTLDRPSPQKNVPSVGRPPAGPGFTALPESKKYRAATSVPKMLGSSSCTAGLAYSQTQPSSAPPTMAQMFRGGHTMFMGWRDRDSLPPAPARVRRAIVLRARGLAMEESGPNDHLAFFNLVTHGRQAQT